jgi:hypothetical protein
MHIETELSHPLSTAIHTQCTGEKTPKLPSATPNPILDNTQRHNALLWKN